MKLTSSSINLCLLKLRKREESACKKKRMKGFSSHTLHLVISGIIYLLLQEKNCIFTICYPNKLSSKATTLFIGIVGISSPLLQYPLSSSLSICGTKLFSPPHLMIPQLSFGHLTKIKICLHFRS